MKLVLFSVSLIVVVYSAPVELDSSQRSKRDDNMALDDIMVTPCTVNLIRCVSRKDGKSLPSELGEAVKCVRNRISKLALAFKSEAALTDQSKPDKLVSHTELVIRTVRNVDSLISLIRIMDEIDIPETDPSQEKREIVPMIGLEQPDVTWRNYARNMDQRNDESQDVDGMSRRTYIDDKDADRVMGTNYDDTNVGRVNRRASDDVNIAYNDDKDADLVMGTNYDDRNVGRVNRRNYDDVNIVYIDDGDADRVMGGY